MNSVFAKSILIAWASYGLVIDETTETQESITFYISVPETSDLLNVDGKMMAGKFLAQRFKKTLTDMGVKRLTVKFKVRENEHWTKEDEEKATLEKRKQLFKSQY